MTNRCTTAQSTEVARRWVPPAIVTLAATATLTALTADTDAELSKRFLELISRLGDIRRQFHLGLAAIDESGVSTKH